MTLQVREFSSFVIAASRSLLKGGKTYYVWVIALMAVLAWGALAYVEQLSAGLVVTNMRDPVSWGLYIGNFTFLVGIAAAAVTLVIPAYFYGEEAVKQVTVFGEILAISALIMCMLLVTVDLGHPERVWHMMPVVGKMNFPASPLAWDVLVLNAYLFLNVIIAGYILFRAYRERPYDKKLVYALAVISVPTAISIHTVTAFIFSGLATRSMWSSAILAPRFIASAFCSGPAVMIILFQVLRQTTKLKIGDQALWRLAEIMTYALAVNLFFLASEVYTEYYPHTHHTANLTYLFKGTAEHKPMAPYMWAGLGATTLAFLIVLSPWVRRKKTFFFLNLACMLVFSGLYIEKAMGHVLGGFTPSPMGEIYEYTPTMIELRVGAGVAAIGGLILTFLCKIAIDIETGELTESKTLAAQQQAQGEAADSTSEAGQASA